MYNLCKVADSRDVWLPCTHPCSTTGATLGDSLDRHDGSSCVCRYTFGPAKGGSTACSAALCCPYSQQTPLKNYPKLQPSTHQQLAMKDGGAPWWASGATLVADEAGATPRHPRCPDLSQLHGLPLLMPVRTHPSQVKHDEGGWS